MAIGTYSATLSINSQLVLRDWYHRKERELRAANWRLDQARRASAWAPVDTPIEEWVVLCRKRQEALVEVYKIHNELGSLYDILTDSGYRCRMYIQWGEPTSRTDEEIREDLREWIKKRTTPGWDPFGDDAY